MTHEMQGETSPTVTRVRVAILEDQEHTRDGIVWHIYGTSDLEAVLATDDVGLFLETVESGGIDVAVIDVRIRGVTHPEFKTVSADDIGLEVLRRIRRSSPRTRCVVNTAYPTAVRLYEAWRLGAMGFVDKEVRTSSQHDLLDVIRRAHQGVESFPPALRERIAQDHDLAYDERHVRLSVAQLQDLRLLASLGSIRKVAEQLLDSEKNVYARLARAMEKLGARSHDDAIMRAKLRGLF